MAKNKIKVGVIGCGCWGKNLIRVFSQLGALDTVCDVEVTKLRALNEEYPKVNVTRAYADILSNKLITAVVIATPTETHFRLAKESLLADKDIFVEKPLATDTQDGIELVELAKKRKRILMVGHILAYHPAITGLKELINNGSLGRIQYIYSNRLNLGKIRKEENILWSFAPHDISAILFLLDKMPEMVSVCGGSYINHDIADVTVSNLSFANGIKGHIFVSWLHPYKEQKLIVVGDKKMAVFDDSSGEDKLQLFNHKIEWVNRVAVAKKENAEKIPFKMQEPLLLECAHFIDCLKMRKSPKTDGVNALRVLKILKACQESLEKGGIPVFLNGAAKEKNFVPGYTAHPTSIIEQPCQIGEGTKIWHYSHVMRGARIGRNCNIGQGVFIGSRAVLGNNIKVQNNVSIYDGVKLEDDVFCGPSVVFTNVINPRSHISRKSEYRKTLVRRGATLGANSTIICGNTIGEYAFVGAGSVVTKDVPDYALVYGNPAEIKGWVCRCGVKIRPGKKCPACGKKYKVQRSKISPDSRPSRE